MQDYLLMVFVVSAVLQLSFIFLYAVVIGNYKRTNELADVPVSVILCARNELRNLQQNLIQLLNQKHAQFEIIVVNDRSTDGSYDYLIELKSQYQNFKLVQVDSVPDHIHSKKYAITLGVKAAQYDSLLFTDADCRPSSLDWISEMASEKLFVLGTSLYEKRKGLLNLFIRFETYITAIQYIGMALVGKPYMGVGRNMGYKKQLFINKKGFNQFQAVVGGDDDLFVNQHINRKNTEVVIGKESLVYSLPKTSWTSFFIQKTRHLSVGKYYKITDKILLGFFILSLIIFWASGITLAFIEPYVVLAGFLLRVSFIYLLFYFASKRFGERFVPLILPILDFLYVIYYISAGTVAAFSKKVKWN